MISAVRAGHARFVAAMIRGGANVNAEVPEHVESALEAAARSGHLNVVELLLRQDLELDTSHSQMKALSAAIEHGHLSVVQRLIGHQQRIDPPVFLAALLHNENGDSHSRVFEWFLQSDLLDVDGALDIAAIHNDLHTVKRLLDRGADIALSGPVALECAVRSSDKHVARRLVDAGANVNHVFEDGCTILHEALLWKQTSFIPLLLEHGANVNIVHPMRGTALHIASAALGIRVIEQLLKAGADVNMCHPELGTPLHVAVERGHEPVCEFLLRNGADVKGGNPRDDESGAPLTVLRKAVHSGDESIIELLVKYGADSAREHNNYQQIPVEAE
ncbi:ankyrin repeat-containing domain protein [Flagelloscypha sp. PMI_526]|nr:ankyrin repeat-containing domain protein [Flagelloscypha sp. PMI_526]